MAGDPDALARRRCCLILGQAVGFHDIQFEVFKGDALVEIVIAHAESGLLQVGGQVFHVRGAGGEAQPVPEGLEIAEIHLAVNLRPEHAVAVDGGFEFLLAPGQEGFDLLVLQAPGNIPEEDHAPVVFRNGTGLPHRALPNEEGVAGFLGDLLVMDFLQVNDLGAGRHGADGGIGNLLQSFVYKGDRFRPFILDGLAAFLDLVSPGVLDHLEIHMELTRLRDDRFKHADFHMRVRLGAHAVRRGGGDGAVPVPDGGDDAVFIHRGDLPVRGCPDRALHGGVLRQDVGDLLPGLAPGQGNGFIFQGDALNRLCHQDRSGQEDGRIRHRGDRDLRRAN